MCANGDYYFTFSNIHTNSNRYSRKSIVFVWTLSCVHVDHFLHGHKHWTTFRLVASSRAYGTRQSLTASVVFIQQRRHVCQCCCVRNTRCLLSHRVVFRHLGVAKWPYIHYQPVCFQIVSVRRRPHRCARRIFSTYSWSKRSGNEKMKTYSHPEIKNTRNECIQCGLCARTCGTQKFHMLPGFRSNEFRCVWGDHR